MNAGGGGGTRYFDPPVATGYQYIVESGPIFESISLSPHLSR